MLFKLALSGLRSRFKDYLVLFSGLIVTSAIFYMFLSLSTNPDFLNQNPTVKSIGTLFIIGDILLGIITLVYVIYANGFLLSMRQRDYGLFMMLGANSSKIGNLIFVETLFLGVLATVVGSVIGVFATQGVAGLLVNNLGLSIKGFIGLHVPAVLWTILFFFVLFFLAALFNRLKLSTIPILSLLKGDQKPVSYRRNPALLVLQAVVGIGALAVAYYTMFNINKFSTFGFWIALVGIVVGTFLVFKSFFTVLINMLRKWKRLNHHGLNNFTINQLKFRITDYTRILSVVSILFAMAVGAITVSLSMRNMAFDNTENAAFYNTAIYSDEASVKAAAEKLPIQEQSTFHYKVDGQNVYALASEATNQTVKTRVFDNEGAVNSGRAAYKLVTRQGDEAKNDINNFISSAYSMIHPDNQIWSGGFETPNGVQYHYVDQTTFNRIPAEEHEVQLIKTTGGMRQNWRALTDLDNLQLSTVAANGSAGGMASNHVGGQGITYYKDINALLSSFQFMGIFLGVAFLTMLASILIFKILSGAHQDKQRYQMLDKIGARRSVMTRSIAKELAVLFILPGLMGLMHMLFGLKLFELMVPGIYGMAWLPIIIFLGLYFLYYLLTLSIYRSIVLRKRN
ncbi:FtsX-like permease family protein [Holzapfeliella sp. He02]|uniref:FtsX-like permease family protein n=1 Tax=Holzapfeliella saturejae TaxID=3082953 RepID=A0ABU8SEQ4_9LACO